MLLVHPPMKCIFLYFLRAYCLATRGGVMWRASYEWSYNLWMDISRKPSKAQTFVYWGKRCVKDWNGAEHGKPSALFLKSSLSSPPSLSVIIPLSLSGWLNVCPSLLITPVSSPLLLFCPFLLVFFPPPQVRSPCSWCVNQPNWPHSPSAPPSSPLAPARVDICLVSTVKLNFKYLGGLLLLKELWLSKGLLKDRVYFSTIYHVLTPKDEECLNCF